MKKKLLSLVLTLGLILSLLPTAAIAAETNTGNFAEENVTWIGTQTEFQQTLDGFYNNGMRKVKVAGKWGIMDATGAFIAPPIYDKIEPEYVVPRNAITDDPLIVNSEARERLFVGGYTQCIRGGKYGLLNQYGEEVIPAKYDAVGLPSEGICRIVQKSGGTSYLGYWSLELGRELVAPNKYVVSGLAATAEGSVLSRQMIDTNWATAGIGGSHEQGAGSASIDYEEVSLSDDRLAAKHDFVDGYAFVTTDAQYGTILDKTGKEILPGGPYLFRSGIYPQVGPYMVYCKRSDQDYNSEKGNLGRIYNSGVVGPEGIIIPAQYNGGVRTPFTGAVVGDARMTIIPELKLVITAKDTKPGKEDGGKVGVVNFKNQTVIPFTHDFNYFKYDAVHKVFAGLSDQGNRIYTATGARLNNSDYAEIGVYGDYAMINGYAQVTTYSSEKVNGVENGVIKDAFVNLKTGAELMVGEHQQGGGSFTFFSKAGLVWLKNAQNKWGLVTDTGKVVLPYQFDAVDDTAWTRAENGYAIVNIGHKQGIVSADGRQIVPCEYDKLHAIKSHGPVDPEYVEATKNGKMGLISAITGKLTIPCIYEGIGGKNEFMYRATYFPLGVQVVKTAEGQALVDRSGNLVPGSTYKVIDTPIRGLFTIQAFNGVETYSRIGPEGKIVLPNSISYQGNKELEDSEMTLVVKNGRVGYINTGLLARPTQPKAYNPATATAALDTGKGYKLSAAEIIPAPGFVEQTKTRNKLKINKLPVTEYYMTKNHTFDTTGMNVSYFDENGDPHDVPIDQLTFTADGNKITDGYVFRISSIKNATVSYKDVSASFRIFVYQGAPEVELDPVPGATNKAIADGKYTISCLGNSFGMSNGWMVLDSKNPVVFDVKNEGDYYSIFMEGVTWNSYIGISMENGQLIANSKGKWTITNLGGDTYSVRQYAKPEMVVCTGGASKADGATVIVWKHTDTPKNAILTFTPAK